MNYENLTSCNDLTFTYTILACAKTVVKINRGFYHYDTAVPNQISANRGNKSKNLILAFDALKRNLESKNLFKTYKKDFLTVFLRCIKYELKFIQDSEYKQNFIDGLRENYKSLYNKIMHPHRFKIFHKKSYGDGKREIYCYGFKVFSYKKQ